MAIEEPLSILPLEQLWCARRGSVGQCCQRSLPALTAQHGSVSTIPFTLSTSRRTASPLCSDQIEANVREARGTHAPHAASSTARAPAAADLVAAAAAAGSTRDRGAAGW